MQKVLRKYSGAQGRKIILVRILGNSCVKTPAQVGLSSKQNKTKDSSLAQAMEKHEHISF